MSYLHHPYQFAVPAGIPLEQSMAYEAQMPHPAMASTMDGYIYAHPTFEMAEFYPQPTVIEDYEEYAENLSRPRLTKEQVDTLEAQFQAHPKPNSNVKRQLALQTNLTLPRVAVSEFSTNTRGCSLTVRRIGFRIDEQRPSNRRGRRNSRGCKGKPRKRLVRIRMKLQMDLEKQSRPQRRKERRRSTMLEIK